MMSSTLRLMDAVTNGASIANFDLRIRMRSIVSLVALLAATAAYGQEWDHSATCRVSLKADPTVELYLIGGTDESDEVTLRRQIRLVSQEPLLKAGETTEMSVQIPGQIQAAFPATASSRGSTHQLVAAVPDEVDLFPAISRGYKMEISISSPSPSVFSYELAGSAAAVKHLSRCILE
ncbi:hypothetical protein FQ775_09170 [Nitratireductor mangrovi]|uniref:Uncharacterized protein n=1 Tax=Nitratireductor mangrovi TaxID=2599600 RepID=A0A5B8KYI9_9HYPH|nr:hypothetical protein [Nitratireductor mangrovi]QDZ00538.1 hypothetical protein FQ775_09170 [Nitratireductor mangrovi]